MLIVITRRGGGGPRHILDTSALATLCGRPDKPGCRITGDRKVTCTKCQEALDARTAANAAEGGADA